MSVIYRGVEATAVVLCLLVTPWAALFLLLPVNKYADSSDFTGSHPLDCDGPLRTAIGLLPPAVVYFAALIAFLITWRRHSRLSLVAAACVAIALGAIASKAPEWSREVAFNENQEQCN